ncbi:MAG TPA: ATP-binding protein [Pirellulales bacterium]|nr:ATP-binding protein [Pirellulales bacterium]
MFEFLSKLFDTSGFPPRWTCGTGWTDSLGWMHIVSDAAIFGAYTAIPLVLAFFILRRRDVPFPRILWLFVAFIFACGFGHLIESVIFWHPVYRLSGLVKLSTALVSWGTVFALVWVVPQALNFPGLARLNNELRGEVEERKRVEYALRESEVKLASLLESERIARGDAETANRLKDDFLSTVSHELRTPLHAILGYSQLLRYSHTEHDQIGEGLAVIERNAKAQAQIIDDLLDMGRIVSGKVRLDVTHVDLIEVIEAAVETVRPAAEAKGIRIQTVLDPRASAVMGDSGRLQQVVWNLLANAIKFNTKEGRVKIVLKRINSHAEIQVTDTGQGIDPAVLPYVFERFRQGDSSTARKYGGLGLGLSIVKHLVELHGGTATAHSAGAGQGATFILNLPIRSIHPVEPPAEPSAATAAGSAHPSISLKGLRVLVVDDEPDARELVKKLLMQHDADVTLASSAEEALQLFDGHPPDVILSDVGMPERDGYDLIREIRGREESQGGKVPAAALTALARAEDRKRAMLAGFQGHITKPVDPGELVAVVATLTGRTGR